MKKLLLILTLISTMCYSQGDCPNTCLTTGGFYAATAGSIAELNVGNRGCLSANEANSSYWYQVCFTTAGVYQFFLDPSGNRNDFDFAVWNGSACPPTTAPIRCSWAAVPPGGPCATCDHTGLGNGAVDLSEGAGGNQWVAPINVVAGQCLTININNYGSGSNNFTLDLTGTTATMSCLPLPIELSNFSCIATDKFIELNWTTQTELNCDRFEIERSQNGINWIKINTIMGHGTSTTAFNYSFRDNYPPFGENYYRIKQIDYNEDYSYSWINSCSFETYNNEEISYYNILGQKVDITNSVSGIYLRQIKNGEFIKTEKIIKL